MRIAIPLVTGKISDHFGRCEEFALIDVDPQRNEVVRQTRVPAPAHQPGLLPGWLKQQDVKLVLAGGMGPRAQSLLTQEGIEVMLVSSPGNCEAVVKAYLAETLQSDRNACPRGSHRLAGGCHK